MYYFLDERLSPYEVGKIKKDSIDNDDGEIIYSTACWRGYIAAFEIKDDVLYLNRLKSCPNKTISTQEIKVDWVTGILTIGYKKENDKEAPKWRQSIYHPSDYLLFEIANGEIKRVKDVTKKEYELLAKEEYEAFMQTVDYKKAVKDIQSFEKIIFSNKLKY